MSRAIDTSKMNVLNYRSVIGRILFVSPYGKDSFSGVNPSQPKKTLFEATRMIEQYKPISKENPAVIVLLPGNYVEAQVCKLPEGVMLVGLCGEEATILSHVNNSKSPVDNLDQVKGVHVKINNKESRLSEINKKTDEYIKQGFEFNGVTFSLSRESQQNIQNLKQGVDDGMLTKKDFPRMISSIDDKQLYRLAYEDVNLFWKASQDRLNKILTKGRILKDRLQ